MDSIEQIRAFVATAQSGSFTMAAKQLGVSNRLTSKYVADLEMRLGVRLFQRTTRKVGLTPAGEDLLARAPALLDDYDSMVADLAEGSQALTGALRISAPVTFGEIYVGKMLGRFAELHPDLTCDLRLDDRYVDLAEEGIDLAFRLGRTDMLSVKTRRLGMFHSAVVASPDYLRRHGTPQEPDDLRHHRCIIDTNRRSSKAWTFETAGAVVSVEVKGRFHVNSANAAAGFAADGLGIAYVPRFAVRDALASGRLVPLLPQHRSESSPLNAVYLEGRVLPRKTRALIDFAVADIKQADILWHRPDGGT